MEYLLPYYTLNSVNNNVLNYTNTCFLKEPIPVDRLGRPSLLKYI